MSAVNPLFKHSGRAAYEMPSLITRLGDVDISAALTDDQVATAEAIQSHAHNATEFIASGLQAIGKLMAIAGCSDDEISATSVVDLGNLIQHLGVEIEYLHEVESDMHAVRRAAAANKSEKKK